MTTQLVLLAAGQGTRMKSDLPKMLHQIGGLPVFAHALRSVEPLEPERKVIVVGHGGDAVGAAARALDPDVIPVTQTEQLGTGHAVLCAKDALAGAGGDTVVLFGDTPFVRPETLERMKMARAAGNDLVILGFEPKDPARYGRLVMDGDSLERIVEWKDASDEELAITRCNSGMMMAPTDIFFDLLAETKNDNAQGEYYLTDAVEIARGRGLQVTAIFCDEAETLGVNSRADLAAAEAFFQSARRDEAMASGTTLIAPETVFFTHDTALGRDTIIEPNVVFGPGVTVADKATIRSFSHLEGCSVSPGASVGPFARLRPGTEIGPKARVGNFCELKNATLGEGAKVNHLSYVGDASVGPRSNIGAGTVTCNYDGVFKHRTEIGANVFIGSDTMLVAPVTVGDDAMTATGAVVTKDVPAGDLALARVPQENKAGYGLRLMNRLKAAKAARQKG